MTTKSWTLTDVENDLYMREIQLGPQDAGGEHWSVVKRRLEGGLSDGVDEIRVDNGLLAFTVLPTRGMSLWRAWMPGQIVGWRSPIRGPVHPQFVPLMEPSGLGWLDGFNELMVRCGLASNGAPDFDTQGRLTHPLHGRIANRPAHRVDVAFDPEAGEITVTGVVEETRFHFQKLRMTTTIRTRLGEPSLHVCDEVENFSAVETGMQMLYHANFGPPFCVPGSKLVLPARTVVPRDAAAAESVGQWDTLGSESPGSTEQVYFFELISDAQGQTRTLLADPSGELGVSLLYRPEQLPCFTVWKNTPGQADGFVTGLEPGTNFPNPYSYEAQQERVVRLPPGGRFTMAWSMEIHANRASVEQAEQHIEKISGGATPNVCLTPQPGWCVEG